MKIAIHPIDNTWPGSFSLGVGNIKFITGRTTNVDLTYAEFLLAKTWLDGYAASGNLSYFIKEISLSDFGAIGDGTTNDTTAIQAALTFAGTHAVGKLIFDRPSANYKCGSLTISDLSNMIIEGNGSQLTATGTLTTPMFLMKDSDHIVIKDLIFQATGGSGTFDLLHLDACSYGSVHNCTFYNSPRYGARIEKVAGLAAGGFFNELRQCHAFNSTTANYYCGTDANETHIYGGECNSSPYGWIVDGADNCTAHGASFEGNYTAGVKVGGTNPSDVRLYGCRFEGGGGCNYGIEIGNSLSTCEYYGGLFTSNLISDIHNPYVGTAYVAGISASVGTTPTPNALGLKIYQGAQVSNIGQMQFQDVGGRATMTGASTTRIATGANYLELAPAGLVVDLISSSLRVPGTYNGGHHIINSSHFWIDTHGTMRRSNAAPVADADGVPFLGYFNVMDFGAKGDKTTDDTSAINAAIAFASAVGGGTVFFPKSSACYRVTSQLLMGLKWCDEQYIKYSYNYDITTTTGYNGTNRSNNAGQPIVCLKGEPGSEIWFNASPSTETALLYCAIQAGQTQGSGVIIEGLSFVSNEVWSTGSRVITAGNSAIVDTHQIGLCLAQSTNTVVRNCDFIGFNRHIVSTDSYWSNIHDCKTFRSTNGFELLNHNSATTHNLLSSYAHGYGYLFTGQGVKNTMTSTENTNCDIYVPSGDQVSFDGGYLETTSFPSNDQHFRFGDISNPTTGSNYVNWVSIKNFTGSRDVGGHMYLQNAVVHTDNVRLYVTNGASLSVIKNTAFLFAVNSNLPIDYTNSTNSGVNAVTLGDSQFGPVMAGLWALGFTQGQADTSGVPNPQKTAGLSFGTYDYWWHDVSQGVIRHKPFGNPSTQHDGNAITPMTWEGAGGSAFNNVSNGTWTHTDITTLANVAVGDTVVVNFADATSAGTIGLILTGHVTTTGTVRVQFKNDSGSTFNSGSSTVNIRVTVWNNPG